MSEGAILSGFVNEAPDLYLLIIVNRASDAGYIININIAHAETLSEVLEILTPDQATINPIR